MRPGSADAAGGEASHGICLDCLRNLHLLPTEDLLALSQEMLDQLPLGFIELDRDGVVRRYNAAEARAAGLDPLQVVDRPFFTEVAPCTRVREFHGRFVEMTAQPTPARDELDFLFRFRSGDRYAHLDMRWHPERQRFVVLVELLS
ncbi:MAG: PAS domain-containing protein [Planctomycetota bacterium]